MAGNPLPLLLLAGGAFLLLGRKKGAPSAAAPSTEALPSFAPNPGAQTTSSAWTQTWMKRQKSLVDVGINIGDSGQNKDGVDGKPGPLTRAGISEFQGKAGIPVDGKWGPITDSAMVQALIRLAQGFSDVVTTAIGAQIKTALGIKEFVEGWWSDDEDDEQAPPEPEGPSVTCGPSREKGIAVAKSGIGWLGQPRPHPTPGPDDWPSNGTDRFALVLHDIYGDGGFTWEATRATETSTGWTLTNDVWICGEWDYIKDAGDHLYNWLRGKGVPQSSARAAVDELVGWAL